MSLLADHPAADTTAGAALDAPCYTRVMPERLSRSKRPRNISQPMSRIVQEATDSRSESESEGKDPHAVALGRKGGAKGGRARAKKLSPERRSEIARKAAQARWARRDGNMTHEAT